MTNEKELSAALAVGREQRGVEFKGPGIRTEKHFQAKVVRAMLGMANKPNGGSVVIGVEDTGTSLNPIGLTEDELATWGYDDLASNVSTFADPYVDFSVSVIIMDGKSFVAIHVDEFDNLPVICKRDYASVLRNGALYVRRRGKNETVEVPSHAEMREVLQRAAELLARSIVASHKSLLEHAATDINSEKKSLREFDSEAEDLL